MPIIFFNLTHTRVTGISLEFCEKIKKDLSSEAVILKILINI